MTWTEDSEPVKRSHNLECYASIMLYVHTLYMCVEVLLIHVGIN